MKGISPKFLNSPFLGGEPGNWYLKEGAPEELVKEFSEFMNNRKLSQEVPTIFEINDEEKKHDR